MKMEPAFARDYWKALLDNATALIQDAHLLLENESVGRARTLTVLAEEELGKALWVYEVFEKSWTAGDDKPRDLDTSSKNRAHLEKYKVAFTFGNELERFWGGGFEDGDDFPEDDDWEAWHARKAEQAAVAAAEANRDKNKGLYVDLVDGVIQLPTQFHPVVVTDDLVRAAQVIEMMLITDHTRMQDSPADRYDATHDLQWRVMRTAHSVEFSEMIDRAEHRRAQQGGT